MNKRTAEGRFQKFIASQPDGANSLPLVHTTSAYSFADICEGDEIVPENCTHFNKKLVYLFYGRPAYRTEAAEFSDLSFNWPIIFIFRPDKIDGITSVYPFDTGAFFHNLYTRFFSKKSDVSDFELSGDLKNASKIVETFYGSETKYIYGKSDKNVEIPPFNYEAEGVQKLAREPSYTSRISDDKVMRDERSSAIEVQSNKPISIADATLAVIMPSNYLTIPQVVDALDRWNLSKEAVRYYEVIGFHEDASWLGQIYSKVVEVYREFGFLNE